VFSFSSLWTAGQGTSWAAKIRPICCTETALTTSLHCVTSQKCKHLIHSEAVAWNHSRLHNCQYWETIAAVCWVRGIKYLGKNIFNILLATLLVILMNVTSRLVYSSWQSAVWHGETQLYIINIFSKFVDAGDILFAETVPRVRVWFLSGTRVA